MPGMLSILVKHFKLMRIGFRDNFNPARIKNKFSKSKSR